MTTPNRRAPYHSRPFPSVPVCSRPLPPLHPHSPPHIFVPANMPNRSATELLLTVAEPTRLRILNCLAAAPLFVSDLQAVLDLPQPTVSRHLQVLRKAQLVRDTPVAQFVLYRLQRDLDRPGRLLGAIL